MKDAIEYHEKQAGSFKAKYLNKESFKGRLRDWQEIIAALDISISRSMDLGCGPGWMTKMLCQISEKVVAVDGSEQMILESKATLKHQADKVDFYRASITPQLLETWEAGSFDLIISSSVLEYVPRTEEILTKTHALLSPGGMLVISLPNKQSLFRKLEGNLFRWFGWPKYRGLLLNIWAPVKTRRKLEDIGFTIVNVQYQGYVPLYSRVFGWLPERFQKPMFIISAKK